MGTAKRSLSDLLAKHQGDGIPDRTAERDAYLEALGELYKRIRVWLKPSVDKKLARTDSSTRRTLTEVGVEPYQASALFVDVGPRRIRFEPAGFSVIGAAGRVDVDAGDRTTTLVLRGGSWFFARRQPKVELIPLDESTFTEAIAELLGE